MPTPAQLFHELKYDKMNLTNDVVVADYLRKHSNEIISIMAGNNMKIGRKVEDQYRNIIFNVYLCGEDYKYDMGKHVPIKAMKPFDFSVVDNNYQRLFVELEHTLQGVPISTAKQDIQLMKDYLKRINNNSHYEGFIVVPMTEACCLSMLASQVCKVMAAGRAAVIQVGEKLALLAHAFVSMLLDVGFKEGLISVLITEDFLNHATLFGSGAHIDSSPQMSTNGCTVIVTETADFDSVLDMLIYEACYVHTFAWRVDKVLVQESVFQNFKNLCTNKLNKKAEHTLEDTEKSAGGNLEKSEEDKRSVQNTNENYFYFDTSKIQAYRTTKELLNLVNITKKPFAISVWCDSVSVTNEITLGANVGVVWVNMYGVFDASVPVQIREQNYSNFVKRMSLFGSGWPSLDEFPTLEETMKRWRTLNRQDRINIVLENVREFVSKFETGEESKIIKNFVNAIKWVVNLSPSEVRIINGSLLTRIRQSFGVIFKCIDRNAGIDALLDIILPVIEGNGAIVKLETDAPMTTVAQLLTDSPRIPIVLQKCDIISEEDKFCINYFQELYFTKSVWSPIGETFAN